MCDLGLRGTQIVSVIEIKNINMNEARETKEAIWKEMSYEQALDC